MSYVMVGLMALFLISCASGQMNQNMQAAPVRVDNHIFEAMSSGR